MWFQKRGLVAGIKDGYCLIVTNKGTYERVPAPASGARVGAEVSYQNPFVSSYLRPVLVAACFLILLLGYALLRQATIPKAMAYVSLDINPSLELSVDKDLNVIDVQYFNNDAANLMKPQNLEGKNLYDALTIIVNQAIAQKYISSDQDNLIVTTVDSTGAISTSPVDQEKIQDTLEKPIQSDGLTSDVKVYSVTNDFRSLAVDSGLSPGKFLVYEQLKDTGTKISIDEVRTNNISKLVDTYKIGLIPDHQKIWIRKHEIGKDPEIVVDDNGQTVPISLLSIINNNRNNHPNSNMNNNPNSGSNKNNGSNKNSGSNRDKNNGLNSGSNKNMNNNLNSGSNKNNGSNNSLNKDKNNGSNKKSFQGNRKIRGNTFKSVYRAG